MRLIAAALVAASFATVAQAEVAGPRIELVAGVDLPNSEYGSPISGFGFGLGLGYDVAVLNGVSLGLDVEATESTATYYGAEAGRDLYAGARVTAAVTEKLNLVGKVGYTNARISTEDSDFGFNLDGFRVAAGAQYELGAKTYVGAEYRYSNYEAGFIRHGAFATLGYRF